MCKVIKEEVCGNKDTYHVSDIEVAENTECKEECEHLEFLVFYERFKTESHKGKPHNAVYPHGVVLLNYAVG